MKANIKNNRLYPPTKKALKIAENSQSAVDVKRREGYISKITPKAVSRVRNDISSWKSALRSADNVETPRRARLYNLYGDILLDAHLTSQIELRLQHILSIPFTLTREGKEAPEETRKLTQAPFLRNLNRHILLTTFWGHTLLELTTTPTGELTVTLLPRNNVIPEKGILLLKEDDNTGIPYRDLREYGTWILEFGASLDYGLLNKAVPHVLFKRFAQSCWSELCEIYGIPPRYIKTDTQDPEMLNRAEQMLRDMGSAAYFIIDREEEFQFAKGADTNGDVYKNFITLCKDELSLLVNGTIIGQDTINGNRSKEESSIKLLDKIIQADRTILEGAWNSTVLPALMRIGYLPQGLSFHLQQEEDIEKLWSMTREALPYMEVDPQWINEKFGIKTTGKRETLPGNLRADTSGFFD